MEHLPHHLQAALRRSEAVVVTETPRAGCPPCEELGATVAQRIVRTIMRAGDESIQRRCQVTTTLPLLPPSPTST